jgi:hypothetical protein
MSDTGREDGGRQSPGDFRKHVYSGIRGTAPDKHKWELQGAYMATHSFTSPSHRTHSPLTPANFSPIGKHMTYGSASPAPTSQPSQICLLFRPTRVWIPRISLSIWFQKNKTGSQIVV